MVPLQESRSAPSRILVIEDEVLIRMTLADELRDTGFHVIEATTADEALSWFEAGGEVDLVFSDIRMPGSLDGIALARRLREYYPALPIILTSGNLAESLGLRVPMAFIPKPYRIEQAIDLITRTLEQERSGTTR